MENKLLSIIPFSEIIIERGKGSWVYDTNGKKYLDLNAGQFCSILGHSSEILKESIIDNSMEIQHTNSGMLSVEILKAAEKLNILSGEMNAKSIFLTTGSEAIEFAIRFAKNLKKKDGIICFNKGYHGLTLGAQSITYGGQYAYPRIKNIFSVEIPNSNNYLEELKKVEKIILENKENIGIILLEPIVSVGGMLLPPKEYFIGLKRLCQLYDIFLIFDESQTGMGRTGSWFYFQKLACTPDIVVLSKGIGGGYPVAAVLFDEKIIPQDGFQITHYSSHQNDPFLGCIVNKIIEYIENNDLLKKIEEKGAYFFQRIEHLSNKYEWISQPRGNGLMLGFDLEIPNVINYREISKRFLREIKNRGVILQATNGGETIRLLPNYLISYEEIDYCIQTIDEVLRDFKNLVIKNEK